MIEHFVDDLVSEDERQQRWLTPRVIWITGEQSSGIEAASRVAACLKYRTGHSPPVVLLTSPYPRDLPDTFGLLTDAIASSLIPCRRYVLLVGNTESPDPVLQFIASRWELVLLLPQLSYRSFLDFATDRVDHYTNKEPAPFLAAKWSHYKNMSVREFLIFQREETQRWYDAVQEKHLFAAILNETRLSP